MNQKQKNHLSMFKVVVAVCLAATEVISQIQAFANAINTLGDHVSEIERLQALQSANNKGVTEANSNLTKELAIAATAISGGLYAFAAGSGNTALKKKVNFVESDFTHFSQSERIAACTTIITEARANAENLSDSGITVETIDSFEALLNTYRNAYTKPRELVVSKSAITEALANEFKQANTLLKDVTDRLALQFKNSDPGFYQQYRQARVIVDRGIRSNGESQE